MRLCLWRFRIHSTYDLPMPMLPNPFHNEVLQSIRYSNKSHAARPKLLPILLSPTRPRRERSWRVPANKNRRNYLESSHAAVHLVQTARCWQLPVLLKPQLQKVKGRADISTLRPHSMIKFATPNSTTPHICLRTHTYTYGFYTELYISSYHYHYTSHITSDTLGSPTASRCASWASAVRWRNRSAMATYRRSRFKVL